jgi:hypothetical protein
MSSSSPLICVVHTSLRQFIPDGCIGKVDYLSGTEENQQLLYYFLRTELSHDQNDRTKEKQSLSDYCHFSLES